MDVRLRQIETHPVCLGRRAVEDQCKDKGESPYASEDDGPDTCPVPCSQASSFDQSAVEEKYRGLDQTAADQEC